MAVQAETPTNNYQHPDPQPYAFDDLDEWLLQHLGSDDPVTLLRNDLIGWLEAGGCRDIAATWLQAQAWEVRFTTNECSNPAEAERLLHHVARGCRCQISQITVIGLGDRFAALLTLRPLPQPEQQ